MKNKRQICGTYANITSWADLVDVRGVVMTTACRCYSGLYALFALGRSGRPKG